MDRPVNLIFGTGTARGGTGLFMQTLSAHSEIEYGLDVFLGLFKSFRSNVVANQVTDALQHGFEESEPLSDYFNSDLQARILESLLEANLDIPFDEAGRLELINQWKPRAAYDGVDLVAHMDDIAGSTYAEMMRNTASLPGKVRGSERTRYTGIHENWTIEMFPALARSFPTAKFIVVLRDPRAVQASHLAAPENLRSSIVSFGRAIRKLHDLSFLYLSDPLFKDRLAVLTYEDLVRDPETTMRRICEFLEVDWEPGMIDPANHVDPWTQRPRDGVSSFESNATSYDVARIDRWRHHLSAGALEITELVLDPDMRFFGYRPVVDRIRAPLTGAAIQTLAADCRTDKSWRTDSTQVEKELGFELVRREIIRSQVCIDDPQMIKRCFINEVLYKKMLVPRTIEENGIALGGLWFAGETGAAGH